MIERRTATRTTGYYLRLCVLDCARDETFVAAFNKEHATRLQVPIRFLFQPPVKGQAIDPDSQEAVEIARFIEYVLLTIWPRVQAIMTRKPWQALTDELTAAAVKERTSASGINSLDAYKSDPDRP